jgi:hypothetical protein
MKRLSVSYKSMATVAALLLSSAAASAQQTSASLSDSLGAQSAPAQQNVPAKVADAEDKVERDVKRFGIGVEAGVGLDPEIIDLGARHVRTGLQP